MSFFMNWNSNQMFDDLGLSAYKAFVPRDKIETTSEGNKIFMALPGVPKSDINIDLKDKTLIVKYEGGTNSETGFETRAFSKAWNLPDSADVENITAESIDGVLTIDVPKREPESGTDRSIVIN
tara:strand:+ start:283 stop:654 length:372 start_codon:yes stop_codon:yes gene_type:complete